MIRVRAPCWRISRREGVSSFGAGPVRVRQKWIPSTVVAFEPAPGQARAGWIVRAIAQSTTDRLPLPLQATDRNDAAVTGHPYRHVATQSSHRGDVFIEQVDT